LYSAYSDDEEEVVTRAIVDIQKGEELTDDYDLFEENYHHCYNLIRISSQWGIILNHNLKWLFFATKGEVRTCDILFKWNVLNLKSLFTLF